MKLDPKDIRIDTFRNIAGGGGSVLHVPSGISVRFEFGRGQSELLTRRAAMEKLETEVLERSNWRPGA